MTAKCASTASSRVLVLLTLYFPPSFCKKKNHKVINDIYVHTYFAYEVGFVGTETQANFLEEIVEVFSSGSVHVSSDFFEVR